MVKIEYTLNLFIKKIEKIVDTSNINFQFDREVGFLFKDIITYFNTLENNLNDLKNSVSFDCKTLTQKQDKKPHNNKKH